MNKINESELPLVSVAIITYNQKGYLRECIESVLTQDYSNLEVVVADDGSTDGTQDMLREYAAKYPGMFVLVLSDKNRGITNNSNSAHFACSGKYIAWMGGDDLMLSDKINKQVNFMENNPDCTICYHDLDVFESHTGRRINLFSEKNKPREGGVKVSIRHGVFNGACSSMVRKNKTPEYGYDESIPVASDWLYWVETLMNGGEIRYINEVLGRYRRHDGNVTNIKAGIGQNVLDHLNSCNLIMTKYPKYFKHAIYRQLNVLVGVRKQGEYFSIVWAAARLTFQPKYWAAVVIYIVTFGVLQV